MCRVMPHHNEQGKIINMVSATATVPEVRRKAAPSPVFATTVAATFESFYRSALNAFINRALLGQKLQRLFPDMHVQIPTRVMYINGIKQSRTWLANNVNPEEYGSAASLVRTGVWVGPGLFMTPVSSLLEAANAGNKNPEPLLTQRWLRGVTARCVREIIFAVGVNQMSEYVEDSIPHSAISNGLYRNTTGSLVAGVMSGYLSHVPHNMSALKLHFPKKSYGELFAEYAKNSEARLPASLSPSARASLAKVFCVVCPAALVARTTQIVGTFILLNGIIYTLKDIKPMEYVGWEEPKTATA
eukprot:TRINITY_DN3444_c0_g1_i1.p1 TRINITY_DN3444_c0_g1~~TRINITY_DN3444_c0_g1_i1.p1  ORF type:complete len:301 (+),score=92.25 TRINITY_DN3444_c0_g1_i1:273-1175(+)